MIPVVTPAEMAAIDEAAPEPVEVLIDRAGRAVARSAVAMMGGVYGRRVVVVAGPGNNGADGRQAAAVLRQRGVRVRVVAPGESGPLKDVDLVIDAAFGTGCVGRTGFPVGDQVPVLAVDIPSGVDGLTGAAGSPCAADRTVTFAAYKPGLLLEPGRSLAGRIEVVDIGLDVSGASIDLVEGRTWPLLPVPDAVTQVASRRADRGWIGLDAGCALSGRLCRAATRCGLRPTRHPGSDW